MNKEKVFIEGYEVGFLVDTTGAREKKIQVASGEIVSIDERFIYKSIEHEKVKIPQFVADYIEFKKANNFHVYGAMRVIEDHYDKRVPEWFYEGNIEKFCLAWILGYDVEKERRYIVTLKSSGQKLYYHTKDEDYIFSSYDEVFYSGYHTKTDLEENDMSWVFDCPGMEIQEVE
nr:MAG TPA: Protein of unknown function (DUF1642) [Caudoviricetes sp.]